MGMQHEIGEQANQFAVAAQLLMYWNRRDMRRYYRWGLEQDRQSLPHAVET